MTNSVLLHLYNMFVSFNHKQAIVWTFCCFVWCYMFPTSKGRQFFVVENHSYLHLFRVRSFYYFIILSLHIFNQFYFVEVHDPKYLTTTHEISIW